MPPKLPERGKLKVVAAHNNGKQLLYQWDQTATQILMEIIAPPPNSSVFCKIAENYIQLGAQSPGLPTTWYLNHHTWGPVNKDESYWKNGKETCKIVLAKANPGVYWRYVVKDDRDDTRRWEQHTSRLPPATLRPVPPVREQVRIPTVRQHQQQRVPLANSRSPSPGRRKSRPLKQDPPVAKSSNTTLSPEVLFAGKPQNRQQQLQQNRTARLTSPGRRRARPVAETKSSLPLGGNSTNLLVSPFKSAEQQRIATRGPVHGRRKPTLEKETTRPSPVKAKPMNVLLPPNKSQHQEQNTTRQSQSPKRGKKRQTKSNGRPELSRSLSAGRGQSGEENIPSSEKENRSKRSFFDRFNASEEGQQERQQSAIPSSTPRAYQKHFLHKEISNVPVQAKKRTVSFLAPPSMDHRQRQQKNESKVSQASSPERRNDKLTKDNSSSPVKTPPPDYKQVQQSTQSLKTSRPISPGRRHAKPTKVDSSSPSLMTRSSSFHRPKEDRSRQYLTRPTSPSPERRRARAAKFDPPSKTNNSSKRALANSQHDHEHDQSMDELQNQIHRVRILKQGMKEYKRRWNEQRQFSDMQSQQIREKQSFVNSLASKLEVSNRRAVELEYERKQDQMDIMETTTALVKSQRRLELLQREHKQALEKIRNLESELQRQLQEWDEMEKNMAGAQIQLEQLSENHYRRDEFQESLAKKAIRELIQSRPDGKAEQKINRLDSELEEQQQDWKELKGLLDLAQTKVTSIERQLGSKKLSEYIIPDTPRVSVNDHLDRMAQKIMSARNQLEEAQRRQRPTSQRLVNMVIAK